MQISVIEFLFGSRFINLITKFICCYFKILSHEGLRGLQVAGTRFLVAPLSKPNKITRYEQFSLLKVHLIFDSLFRKKKQYYVAASTVVKKNIYFIGTEIYPQKS